VTVDTAREAPRASEKVAPTWSTLISAGAKSGPVDATWASKPGASSVAKP
jgi:hypothetical protein